MKLSENVGSDVKSDKSASSLQLTLENKKLIETVAGYEKALKGCWTARTMSSAC